MALSCRRQRYISYMLRFRASGDGLMRASGDGPTSVCLSPAVGKFFQVEYFEAGVENTASVPLEIRSFAESPGRF